MVKHNNYEHDNALINCNPSFSVPGLAGTLIAGISDLSFGGSRGRPRQTLESPGGRDTNSLEALGKFPPLTPSHLILFEI